MAAENDTLALLNDTLAAGNDTLALLNDTLAAGNDSTTLTPPWPVSTLTPPTTQPVSRIPRVDAFYFTVIVLCFLLGSLGNSLALRYFLTKSRDIPTSIYIVISSVDITISVLVLPLALPYVLHNRRGWMLEDSTAFCVTWGILWYVFSVLTIFLVAVLSITRTVQMLCPFRNLRKRVVVAVILSYVVVLFVQSTIPMWIGHKYTYYYTHTAHCAWKNSILNGTAYHVYTQVIFFETYFPIFPILISCVLTIRSLKSSDNSALNNANREVTITIVLFTVLYMVCNIPPVVMHLITIIVQNHASARPLITWDIPYWYWFKFYYILLIPINSALNPLVYMWRMRKMRESTVKMARGWLATATRKMGSPLSSVRKLSMTASTRV